MKKERATTDQHSLDLEANMPLGSNIDIIRFDADRASGLDRLNCFAPFAGSAYSGRRNYDFGPEKRGNISCLSPWIRHRAVHEEEVIAATLKHHSAHKAEKFLQEVFWRGYFKGWLEHHPTTWSDYGDALQRLDKTLADDGALRRRYDKAIDGRTGIEGFDQWIQELYDIGYLHNHARMWFASIWIFTLQLPWQLGADLFFRHLIDGDPASNTLSWRWVAGLHTVGKTYLARPDNIEKYTDGRFSPAGLSPNADAVQEANRPTKKQLADNDVPFITGRMGLLLTEDDCLLHKALNELPNEAFGNSREIEAIACLMPSETGADGRPKGQAQKGFVKGILSDALKNKPGQRDAIRPTFAVDDGPSMILDWARTNSLDCVVAPFAPVGTSRSYTRKINKQLRDAGIDYIEVKRRYDTLVWPHASKGFFGLKKKIPELLQQIAINR